MTYDVESEVALLREELKRIGTVQPDGTYKTTFGVVFKDERVEQLFESLVGTLKAAKKRGVLTFQGEILLQGAHDHVEIVLLKP